MAKDRKKLQHIHSSIPDKQPTPASLEVGEIAVNNAAKHEFLSIKNSEDKVKRFSSDEQMITWMERKEVVPFVGQVRGDDYIMTSADTRGSVGITNNDLLRNKSNIVIKMNQVAAGNTPKSVVINGAKDIYGHFVNLDVDGTVQGAGFAIDMSRYAMIGANPSFSSLTVTDKTDLKGNTTITDGDGTGTRTGHTLYISTTNVFTNDLNWNDTITNKISTIANESSDITSRNTTVGTEKLHVSGTTTETRDGIVTETNNSNKIVNTSGSTTETRNGIVTETNNNNKVVNTSGTTTYNNSGTTITNETGDTIFYTSGNTIIETRGDNKNINIETTGNGGDINIFSKDVLNESGDTVNITSNKSVCLSGGTSSNTYAPSTILGEACGASAVAQTTTIKGVTINESGTTFNQTFENINTDVSGDLCLTATDKASLYGSRTDLGVSCDGASATTVNVSGTTVNEGGTTLNQNFEDYNVTARDNYCLSAATKAGMYGKQTDLGVSCNGTTAQTINVSGTTVNEGGTTLNQNFEDYNVTARDNYCLSAATKAGMYGSRTDLGVSCDGTTANTINISGTTVNEGGTTLNQDFTNINTTAGNNLCLSATTKAGMYGNRTDLGISCNGTTAQTVNVSATTVNEGGTTLNQDFTNINTLAGSNYCLSAGTKTGMYGKQTDLGISCDGTTAQTVNVSATTVNEGGTTLNQDFTNINTTVGTNYCLSAGTKTGMYGKQTDLGISCNGTTAQTVNVSGTTVNEGGTTLNQDFTNINTTVGTNYCLSAGTKTGMYGKQTDLGISCNGTTAQTVNVSGTTVNEGGTTLNQDFTNINTTVGTNYCLSAGTKTGMYGKQTDLGISCNGTTAQTVNVSGTTVNEGGTTLNQDFTNINVTTRNNFCLNSTNKAGMYGKQTDLGISCNGTTAQTVNVSATTVNEGGTTLNQNFENINVTVGDDYCLSAGTKTGMYGKQTDLGISCNGTTAQTVNVSATTVNEGGTTLNQDFTNINTTADTYNVTVGDDYCLSASSKAGMYGSQTDLGISCNGTTANTINVSGTTVNEGGTTLNQDFTNINTTADTYNVTADTYNINADTYNITGDTNINGDLNITGTIVIPIECESISSTTIGDALCEVLDRGVITLEENHNPQDTNLAAVYTFYQNGKKVTNSAGTVVEIEIAKDKVLKSAEVVKNTSNEWVIRLTWITYDPDTQASTETTTDVNASELIKDLDANNSNTGRGVTLNVWYDGASGNNKISADTKLNFTTPSDTNAFTYLKSNGEHYESGTTIVFNSGTFSTAKYKPWSASTSINVPTDASHIANRKVSWSYGDVSSAAGSSYVPSQTSDGSFVIPKDASHINRRSVSWSYGNVTGATGSSYEPGQSSNGSFVIPNDASHIKTRKVSWSYGNVTGATGSSYTPAQSSDGSFVIPNDASHIKRRKVSWSYGNVTGATGSNYEPGQTSDGSFVIPNDASHIKRRKVSWSYGDVSSAAGSNYEPGQTSDGSFVIPNDASHIKTRKVSWSYGSVSGATGSSYTPAQASDGSFVIPNDAKHLNRRTVSWSYGSVCNASNSSYDPGQTDNASFVIPKSLSDVSCGYVYDSSPTTAGGCITFSKPICVPNSNTITAGGAIYSSDKTLKENIVSIKNNEDLFNKAANVDIVSFNFKDDEKKNTKYGVIAQDIQEIGLGELVHETEGKLGVDYTSLLMLKIAYLENTIKNLTEKIEKLENK